MQSSVHQTESLLFFTLLQLVIIILAARLAGAVAERASQSRAVGEIVAGLLLGPSLFGLLAPDAFQYVFRSAEPEPMTILSQVGLILLMFQIGLEFDFSHLGAARNRQAVLRVSAVGLVLPFLLGLLFGWLSAPSLAPGLNVPIHCLFVGTAFSITALPVLGRMRSSGLDARESRAIGIMMNTRGLMELVVLNVGLDLGVIPPRVFTMLVIMAIVSTLVTTPALKVWLRRERCQSVGGANSAGRWAP